MRNLQLGLIKSDLWPALCYSAFIKGEAVDTIDGCNFEDDDCNTSSENEMDEKSVGHDQLDRQDCLAVDLRCQIFDSIVPDLLLYEDVGYLRKLNIDLSIYSIETTLHFQDIIEYVQYSLSSLILNLEFKYPFVFSYFGRHITKLNYKSLTNRMAKLRIPLDGSTNGSSDFSLVALRKLENVILTEFNTLNVLKECDMSAHRMRLCSEYIKGLVKDEAKRSIKCKAFKVSIFKQSDWD